MKLDDATEREIGELAEGVILHLYAMKGLAPRCRWDAERLIVSAQEKAIDAYRQSLVAKVEALPPHWTGLGPDERVWCTTAEILALLGVKP